MKPTARVVILTPVTNAADHLAIYFAGLQQLSYPRSLLSLGLLEGDSRDHTYSRIEAQLSDLRGYRRVGLWKRDLGGLPRAHAVRRNHLLFRALDDENYVLWLDVETNDYPSDAIERLLATGYDVVSAGAGGGIDTMTLVRGDVHRSGVVFTPFGNGPARTRAIHEMAHDLGYSCGRITDLPGGRLDPRYPALVRRVTEAVSAVIPRDAVVLVAARGDDLMLAFEGRRGWHFPRAEDGSYSWSYPADSAGAIGHLERLRDLGAGYLVLPATALWWLDHYPGFAAHLGKHYPVIWRRTNTCVMFDLADGPR